MWVWWVTAFGLIAAGCQEKKPDEPEVIPPVKIITVGKPGVEDYRELPGTIKAAQHAELAFEVPGLIIEFNVREGQDVQQGTVLARLDDRNYQANLDKARANLRKSQADFDRGMNVFRADSGAIAQTEIDAYRRAMEVSQAELRTQEKAVEDTLLRAPFAGRVARRLVDDFQNVRAQEPVLILQDLSHLEIEVGVPERDVAHSARESQTETVDARLKPLVIATSVPDRAYPARIKEIATTADPVTRTFQVRLIFDTPKEAQILPGMTAKVRYRVPRKDVIKLPASATFADAQGKAHVWKLDTGSMQVHKTAVELGSLSGDSVAVINGLSPGDQIAASGVHQLREGMKVRRHGKAAN